VIRLLLILSFILLLITFAVFTTMQDIHREITVKYLHLMGVFVGANYHRYLYAPVFLKVLTTHFMVLIITFNMGIPLSTSVSGLVQSIGYPLQQLLYSFDCYTLMFLDKPVIFMRLSFSVLYPLLFFVLYTSIKVIQSKGKP
jgi:hypothetical protein